MLGGFSLAASALAFALLASVSATAHGVTLAKGRAEALLRIESPYVGGLNRATAFAFLPDGSMVVTERDGVVKLRKSDGKLDEAGRFAVSLASNEQGLLNVLPHPRFAENRLLYFYYSAPDDAVPPSPIRPENRNRLVSVRLGVNGTLEPGTQKILLQNLWGWNNHNGGALAVLGDKLFVGVGDATAHLYGNCLTNANGKVLRLNLDGSIPSDNPLVGRKVSPCESMTAPRTEIWAWGLRNPWRLWPDPKTGNVWVGDVGDAALEEIDVIPKSGAVHLGWPHREGNQPSKHGGAVTSCSRDNAGGGDCREPVYVCKQPECRSITGGPILDACEWPAELEGRYVFGDHEAGTIWTLGVNGTRDGVVGQREPVATAKHHGPIHFVEHGGALYALFYGPFTEIARISPKKPDPPCAAKPAETVPSRSEPPKKKPKPGPAKRR